MQAVDPTDHTDPIPMPDGFVVPPHGNQVRHYEPLMGNLLVLGQICIPILADLHPHIGYLLLISCPMNSCLNTMHWLCRDVLKYFV